VGVWSLRVDSASLMSMGYPLRPLATPFAAVFPERLRARLGILATGVRPDLAQSLAAAI
jgi:hypothetical protein